MKPIWVILLALVLVGSLFFNFQQYSKLSDLQESFEVLDDRFEIKQAENETLIDSLVSARASRKPRQEELQRSIDSLAAKPKQPRYDPIIDTTDDFTKLDNLWARYYGRDNKE